MNKDITNLVLDFYKDLPFNIYQDPRLAIKSIKNFDFQKVYPFLVEPIEKSEKIIDVGCGGGWLTNAIAYHFKKQVFGLDFNPLAIEHAKKISKELKNNNSYVVADIFNHNISEKFDLIISLGVLHHTKNCLEGLKQFLNFGKKKAICCVGLYHKLGRKPFLESIKYNQDLNDKEKFEKYKSMHPLKDSKHQLSWYKDQILHPHETHHDLKEIKDALKKNNYEFISTSINNFEKVKNINDIYEKEKLLHQYALKKIQKNQYYPGFFIIMAQNEK